MYHIAAIFSNAMDDMSDISLINTWWQQIYTRIWVFLNTVDPQENTAFPLKIDQFGPLLRSLIVVVQWEWLQPPNDSDVATFYNILMAMYH